MFVDASRCAPEYFEEDAAFHYAVMALPARRLVPLLLGEDVNVKRLHPSQVAITRGPLRLLLVDFLDLLVGFFAFRTTQRAFMWLRSSFPTPNHSGRVRLSIPASCLRT
jgi:hypothetical protein